jgi:hypothetical protein
MGLLVVSGRGLGLEDKRPKFLSLNGPKFLVGGPSARLQGARKQLRVLKAEIVRSSECFSFFNPLPESML